MRVWEDRGALLNYEMRPLSWELLDADLFNNANTIPNALYILVAGGIFNVVLVPQLIRAMKPARLVLAVPVSAATLPWGVSVVAPFWGSLPELHEVLALARAGAITPPAHVIASRELAAEAPAAAALLGYDAAELLGRRLLDLVHPHDAPRLHEVASGPAIILVAGALIENGPTATELTILNRVPLLREKERNWFFRLSRYQDALIDLLELAAALLVIGAVGATGQGDTAASAAKLAPSASSC